MLNFKHVLFDFDNTLANHVSYECRDTIREAMAYLHGENGFKSVEKK